MEDGIEQHLSLLTNMIMTEKIEKENTINENNKNKALEKDNKKTMKKKKNKIR